MDKTVFILAGGNDRGSADYSSRLGDEIAKYFSNPKILSCFFSQPEETWEEKAKDWHGWFSNNFNRTFEYDFAKRSTFINQVESSDVIYLHGGDTALLFNALPDSDELRNHFKGKIIVGSSAGANVLSHLYWSSTKGVLGEGKSLVEVSVMVHYGALNVGDYKRTPKDWIREEAELKRVGGKDVTRLPEGQFVVIVI